MTYRDYKSFWDIFLNKWLRNHDDFILNDSEGQAFFPKDSRGNLIQTDLLENIACAWDIVSAKIGRKYSPK